MPTFTVRMFAYLRDRHGDRVEVEADPTVHGVLIALKDKGVRTDACRLSVNLRFPLENENLSEGDELALIPPVSGG